MKRSTIILIIFLVLLIITPIVIVKTVNKLSPESKLKGIQTLWNKSDPNTPTRYIITEEYFGSDSIGTTINIKVPKFDETISVSPEELRLILLRLAFAILNFMFGFLFSIIRFTSSS